MPRLTKRIINFSIEQEDIDYNKKDISDSDIQKFIQCSDVTEQKIKDLCESSSNFLYEYLKQVLKINKNKTFKESDGYVLPNVYDIQKEEYSIMFGLDKNIDMQSYIIIYKGKEISSETDSLIIEKENGYKLSLKGGTETKKIFYHLLRTIIENEGNVTFE